MTTNKPLVAHSSMREALRRIIQSSRLERIAEHAFMDHPSLETVATLFVHYVTPWMQVDDRNLAESTLREAFAAYRECPSTGDGSNHSAFIERIAKASQELATIRVSVLDSDGQWVVWSYDQPLLSYMAAHNRWSMQIRKRTEPVPAGPVLIKLLAAISSTRDMLCADLNYGELLASGRTA